MTITRRKLLGVLPAISTVFVPAHQAEAKTDSSSRSVLGYELHDDESVYLLEKFARTLALKDETARHQAQEMFHKAEKLILGNQHVTGYGARLRWKACVEAHESGNKPPAFCRSGG